MNEISLFYDPQKKSKVEGNLNFGVIEAGKTTSKEIYLTNNTEHAITLKINVIGEDIELQKELKELRPYGTERLLFEFSPKVTKIQPIEGEIIIKYKFIVG